MSIFDELRQKYNRLYYPNTGEKQFETFKNLLKKDILNSEFEQARIEYQNILSNRGLNRSSIDATTGGEQQQIVTNPITGATEIITPEYNRQFRTDKTDFMPGGSELFRNIYDEDLGSIDPITGEVKEIENIIDTGLISDSNKQQGGKGQNQQDNQRYSYETLNGRTFRIDNVTKEVEEANMPFGTASLLGTFANAIPGVQDYRLANMTPEDRQALQMANAVSINKEMNTNANERRAAVEKEFMTRATEEQKNQLAKTDAQRGIISAKSDPSKASKQGSQDRQDRQDKQRNKDKSGPLGKGQYGGR